MFDASRFTVPDAKPMPVLLLLDVSGSMTGAKIAALNQAVREMIHAFANEVKLESDILVSIITFGRDLQLLFPFTPASEVHFQDLTASGATPLGVTLQMAKAMIEDKETTPGRAYRPVVVLVSDGQPTDRWEEPLQAFISEGRSSKCDRMAMAIGNDADRNVLNRFIQNTGNPLFEADSPEKILEFFKKVTMSVSVRTQPNGADTPQTPAEEEKKNGSVLEFSSWTGKKSAPQPEKKSIPPKPQSPFSVPKPEEDDDEDFF